MSYQIEIVRDDSGFSWEDALGEEPVSILYFERTTWEAHVCFDNSSEYIPRGYHLVDAIANLDYEEIISESGEVDYWRILPDGRVSCDWNDYNSHGTYASVKNAAIAALNRAGMSGIRIDALSSYGCGWYFIASYDRELNKFAGSKHALPPLSAAQSFINGDVYGYEITDESGDLVDSCYGFFGDESYCEDAAKESVNCLIADYRCEHTKRVKAWIKNRVRLDARFPSHKIAA